MPDQTVTVKYQGEITQPWTFDDRTVHMTAAGKIILKREPHTADWTFVQPLYLGTDYTWDIQGQGSQMTIHDPFPPPYNTPIKYGVQILLGTQYINSPEHSTDPTQTAGAPPPMLQNDT